MALFNTKQVFFLLIFILLLSCGEEKSRTTEPPYGENPKSEQFVKVNGTDIYFETYGNKEHQSLVLIHGNGASIKAMTPQIEYFKSRYYVIVADNRTHGKSGGSDTLLNYEIMANDYNAIINKLKIDSVYVLGHSDGGIIGLLLAINYPDKISKLVAAVPNLVPGESAIEGWELEFSKGYTALIDSMISIHDQSRNWKIEKIHSDLLENYPNIKASELSKIKCPVLVMTSDNDIIKPRHILMIYENIPKAQLFVMPGATHFMIRDEHQLYNMMANRFLSSPFKRPTSKKALMDLIGIGKLE